MTGNQHILFQISLQDLSKISKLLILKEKFEIAEAICRTEPKIHLDRQHVGA